MRPHRTAGRRFTGSIMLETVIALPVVLVLGLSVTQWALVHQARAVIDHATLMAARAGAVNEARMAPMRNAFARAIVPLHLSRRDAADFETAFLIRATPDARLNLRLRILNPTREAFDDHAVRDRKGGRYLPFRHLDRRSRRPGRQSGLNIQDATLLRVQATYGYPLKVPYAGAFIRQALRLATRWTTAYGPRERTMLLTGRLPIVTTATVRMQSRARAGPHFPQRTDLDRVARE
ncbi:TadE/TadG family type IV pilus assembly protein [Spiribacter vilamensis]|uniref:TadE-like protein n=1 Tax=Spiribacter vilamensis TaxID=531306 RepID=A0A4Q8D1D2_9GAMM|nr:TadE family protein [Spiribacter vilamensis]RZU99138.1 TadE-like protein [Spiribacter vilamensis]TVO61867.1 pilus assembly protein [Spiribacter vilamensis]